MDNDIMEILPFESPIYISELLSFQQRQLTCSFICSIEVTISFGIGFKAIKQTTFRIVVIAIIFSSGDMRTRETAPS